MAIPFRGGGNLSTQFLDTQQLVLITKEAHKYLCAGKYKEALQLFTHLTEIAPDYVDGLVGLAGTFFAMNRHKEGFRWIEKAIKYSPNASHILYMYVMMALKVGEFKKAKEIFEEHYEQKKPSSIREIELYIDYLLAFEQTKHVKELAHALTLIKKTPAIYNCAGIAMYNIGELEVAVKNFREGLKLLLHSPFEVKEVTEGYFEQEWLRVSLLEVKRIFTAIKVPFCLAQGTLLGIYRDGKMLPGDSDIDIMLPWNVNRSVLMEVLKDMGCTFNVSEQHIQSLRAQWCLSVRVPPFEMCVEMSFIKPDNNRLLTGFARSNKVIAVAFPKFKFGKIEYLGEEFMIPEDTPTHLEAIYGKAWNQRIRNRNYFIVGENLDDPYHLKVPYALNQILGRIMKGDYKKAHGYALQLFSVYDDPLLLEVCHFLEKNVSGVEWYPPIPLRR
ncbi:hypothetical protein CCZ01_00390 [Helicobacter monodelphidis]|uniref:tetratricopeptide repeat protein n=1 Tax=Helicobacter sp. 15-1451 TaxID=2004995 RepID=UPI000DCAE8EB|nr:LicD family protein [Helicobacter sp. 15-1451]RAX59238.1 hypothetical protein CCZ01_00390 [Helicobacter sp. 15-1451]